MTRINRGRADQTQRVALSALLLAMMLILGFVESMIPLNAGVPGIKLGLSNGVLIFAVYMLDLPTAFTLMGLKVALSGMLFSGPSTMLYGFAGGLLSLCVMALLSRFERVPVVLVSALGGVMHNVGQVLLSLVILQVPFSAMAWYMLVLTGVGAACGVLTGVCAKSVMAHLRHIGWMKRGKGKRSSLGAAALAAALVIAVGVAAYCSLRIGAPGASTKPSVEWQTDLPALDNVPIPKR